MQKIICGARTTEKSMLKSTIHDAKLMLWIWWDQRLFCSISCLNRVPNITDLFVERLPTKDLTYRIVQMWINASLFFYSQRSNTYFLMKILLKSFIFTQEDQVTSLYKLSRCLGTLNFYQILPIPPCTPIDDPQIRTLGIYNPNASSDISWRLWNSLWWPQRLPEVPYWLCPLDMSLSLWFMSNLPCSPLNRCLASSLLSIWLRGPSSPFRY